jgi:hypothetical protein
LGAPLDAYAADDDTIKHLQAGDLELGYRYYFSEKFRNASRAELDGAFQHMSNTSYNVKKSTD